MLILLNQLNMAFTQKIAHSVLQLELGGIAIGSDPVAMAISLT